MTSDGVDAIAKTGDGSASAEAGRRTRNYVLAVLTLVYVFNFIDRQILVILQESIKAEMGLSDTQLGLLSGITFALFYTIMGIPIARWADRANRRNIIAVSLTVWSGMTALCGMAGSYVQLALARVGVGIGEAGGSPPAHSIISDYFPRRERGRALSIYSAGIYIGIMLGYLAGGWANQYFGWRATFLIVGLPGLAIALLVRFTITEPARGLSEAGKSATESPPLREALAILWSYPSFRYFSIASGLTAFMGYGIGNFTPSFLSRSHGLSSGEIGTILGFMSGGAGVLGTFLGGYLADKLSKRGMHWYGWIPAFGLFLGTPVRLLGFMSGDLTIAITAMTLGLLLDTLYLGPTIAACHGLVGPRMRALTSSILFFVLNLIGLGLGPLFVGGLSDYLHPTYGTEALRYAIIITMAMGIIAGMVYMRGAWHYGRDMARRDAETR